MQKKCKILFATYPGDFVLRPPAAEWMQRTLIKCRPVEHLGGGEYEGAWIERWRCDHPQIEEVVYYRRTDTPIDMVRNHSVEAAKNFGCDLMLIIDNDMEPDQAGPRAKLFWETSFPWIFDRIANSGSPALIFAPYMGGLRGANNVFVFKWLGFNNRLERFKAGQFDREEAAARSGIERVCMGPTGLMLIDLRIFDRIAQPYFQYEYEGDGPICPSCGLHEPGPRAHKATTEDCYFTREVTDAWADDPDAGCFCNWDAWAVHHKICGIERPDPITIDQVSRALRKAVDMNRASYEGVQMVQRDPRIPPPKRPAVLVDGRNGDAA